MSDIVFLNKIEFFSKICRISRQVMLCLLILVALALSVLPASAAAPENTAPEMVDASLVVGVSVVFGVVILVFLIFLVIQTAKYRKNAYLIENSDPLTGLRNLQCFFEDAEQLVQDNYTGEYSVLQINIRNFKYINDVYSSNEGDNLLVYLSQIIATRLGPRELQARANADNFIVLLNHANADSVLAFFNELKFDMHRRTMSISEDLLGDIYCGIYLRPKGEKHTMREMAEYARIALRKASEEKMNYAFYEEKLRIGMLRENEIIKSMYDALKNGEFQFYLQPQHHLANHDRVMSAEALVRWVKPDGTIIPPGDFVPIFERNGFIVELDRYIFEEVCRFIKKAIGSDWYEGITIAVNVSRLDLYKRDFTEYYTDVKNKYHIPDHLIELEFTESVVFEDYKTFKNVLYRLRDNGFTCSLDDFGAGSSSLNVLKELPVDVLKMDRLFFTGSDNAERNNSVVASVIAMARGLDMRIVAEGIEDYEQITFLRRIGCDIIQGYAFSKPLPIPDFIEYVQMFRNAAVKLESTLVCAMPERDGPEMIAEKYRSALNFVHALVLELDIDKDYFRVVTTERSPYYYPFEEGAFSKAIRQYIDSAVFEEDKSAARKLTLIENLIACFYRGDDKVEMEFRAKIYNADLGRFINEYEWHSISICRISHEDGHKFTAMVYIQNTQNLFSRDARFKKSQNQLNMAVKGIRGTVYEINIKTRRIVLIQSNSANDKAVIPDGTTFEQLHPFFEKYIHREDREALHTLYSKKVMDEFLDSELDQYTIEFRKAVSGGGCAWKQASFIKSAEEPSILLLLVQDISAKKMMEQRLVSSERRLGGMVDHLYLCVFEVDFEGNTVSIIKTDDEHAWAFDGAAYTDYRDYFCKNSKVRPDMIEPLREFLLKTNIDRAFDSGKDEIVFEYQVMRNETYRWTSISIIREPSSEAMVIVFIRDIDKQKREQERLLNKNIIMDSLTQIYCADALREQVEAYLASENTRGQHLFAAIDIDHFSQINERYGQAFGDLIICSVVQRLRRVMRPGDMLGRVGGDEFVLMMKNTAPGEADLRLSRLMRVFESSFDANSREIYLTASVGATNYPGDGTDEEIIYSCMDKALSAAKAAGGARYAIYTEGLSQKAPSSLGTAIDSIYQKGFDENFIEQIFNIMYSSDNVSQAIPAILSYIGSKFDVSRAYIIELSEDKQVYVNTFEWTADGVAPQIDELQAKQVEETAYLDFAYIEHFDKDNMLVCSDVSELNPVVRELLEEQGIQAVLQCGMTLDGEFYGFIGFDECRRTREWTATERQLLMYISRVLGVFYLNSMSSLRLSQKQLVINSMMDNAPVALYVIDPDDFRLLQFNHSTKAWRPNAEIGTPCYEAFLGGSAPCEFCMIPQWKKNGMEHLRSEIFIDQESSWLECVVDRLDWYDGSKAAMISCYDFTKYINNKEREKERVF